MSVFERVCMSAETIPLPAQGHRPLPGELPASLAFRRRIVINAQRAGEATTVRAAVEDDFHHFRIEVRGVAGLVASVVGDAPRHPYTLCPSATGELTRLIGMPLNRIANAVTRFTNATEQCTHLFDLAGLAIAAAARGTVQRQYDIRIAQREMHGRTQPQLWRDGELLLTWAVNDDLIEAPPPYAGVNLRAGLARWALTTLPEDEAEAALVLRRCTIIALGRSRNLDAQVHAKPSGLCFAQQVHRAEQALRVIGSTRDFSASAQPLCAHDREWLAALAAPV